MIRPKDLEAFGMHPPGDGSARQFPLVKILMESEDGSATTSICLHKSINMSPTLVLRLPTGDLIYLGGVESLDELETIEKCITGFDTYE